jgi:V8-like Glu-specific endopeptidase
MLKKSIQHDVAKATVSLLGQGGQGVLVRNNLILTAAHCINFYCDGRMTLGDYFIEEIKTSEGRKLKVTPYAVEPVSDIVVLGSLDN